MSEPTECVIYTRISKDKEGDALGVARQLKLCRKVAAEAGWTVIGVFEDNNLTAFKRGKRPRYDEMCEVIRSGGAKAIVTYNPDRLTRHPRDLEDLIDLLNEYKVLVRTARSGAYDLSTANGRMAARVAGAVARHESEKNSERLRDKHQELRDAGRPNGGPRPYGYLRAGAKTAEGDTRTLVPNGEEAPYVVEAIQRIAAGESPTAVANSFNERGIPTRRDKAWTLGTVRRMALNGVYAGRRMHEGTDVGPGQWPALVDEREWRRAVALLTSEDRPRGIKARRYLLAGLIDCGACGAPMRSHPAHHAGQPIVPRYVCGKPGCFNGGRAEYIEQIVSDAVVAAVENPAFAKASARRSGQAKSDNAGEAKLIEAEIADLEAEAEAGRVPVKMYTRLNAALAKRLETARGAMVDDVADAAARGYAGRPGVLRRDWEADDGLTLDRKRAIIRSAVQSITLAPVIRPTGPRFDVDRVEVVLARPARSQVA